MMICWISARSALNQNFGTPCPYKGGGSCLPTSGIHYALRILNSAFCIIKPFLMVYQIWDFFNKKPPKLIVFL